MDNHYTFAACIALNNQGVDEFVKEHNLEDASKCFGTALRNLSKRATQLKKARRKSELARQKRATKNRTKQKAENGHHQRTAMTTDTAPITTDHPDDQQQRNVTDDEADQQQTIILAAVFGGNRLGGVHLNRKPVPSSQEVEIRRQNGIFAPEHLEESLKFLLSSTCTTSASPIRLEQKTNGTKPSAENALRQVSLCTVVVCFNLALSHHQMGFLVATGDNEEDRQWNSAFSLYELACSMRLFIHGRKNFERDTLSLLDRILVKSRWLPASPRLSLFQFTALITLTTHAHHAGFGR